MPIDLDANSYDVFAPGTFDDGSSISHFDSPVAAVMNSSITIGTQEREYYAADRAALSALGYNLLAVPEPSSSLLLGLGGFALLYRRRL